MTRFSGIGKKQHTELQAVRFTPRTNSHLALRTSPIWDTPIGPSFLPNSTQHAVT